MFDLSTTWLTIGPLTIVCLLLLTLVIWQTVKLVKSLRKKKDDVSWRVITVVLPLLILLPAVFFEVRLQFSNATITGIVRQISGNPSVRARCQRGMGDMFRSEITYYAHGVAYIDQGLMIVDSRRCHDFVDWYFSDKTNASDEDVWAVAVLVHETVHLEGEWNEAVTECKAMAKYEKVASEILGAPRDEARRMSDIYRNKLHLHTPRDYQMDCGAYWNSQSNADKDGNESKEN